ncbi:MAG: alanine racemase [Candidatus Kerfeldbacteria bacterium]|nr:alanine racemase [Candidatus Kerfeldbacteria bacterium]
MSQHLPITWVEISRSAILHNIRTLRRLLSPGTQFMPIIKSNAYGHGFEQLTKILTAARTAWIGVVNADEALRLRQLNRHAKILILSFFDPALLSDVIRKKIRLPVYGLSAARSINAVAKQLQVKAYVHLKIDTGTSRLGVLPADAVRLALKLRALDHLVVEGIFTHFADAENPDQKVTKRQHALFANVITSIETAGIRIPIKHAACSAALMLNPRTHLDLVRAGIALYGLNSIESKHTSVRLLPALSWHTRVIQVKEIPAGSRIGYGQTYRSAHAMKLAILPVGYWDGYDRKLSNVASVIIKGKKCPVRGRICMNLMMVDVTGVSSVAASDRATLIGYTGAVRISADDLAHHAGTINYEIVTRINPLIPRIIVA